MINSPPKFHAIAWAHAVLQASGMKNSAIENQFMSDGCCYILDGRLKTPNLFRKYLRGKSAPTQLKAKCGGMVFVDRIETKYPNTKCWLFLPLWKLLYDDPLELSQIWRIMVNTNIKNLDDFFIPTPSGGYVRTGQVTREKLINLENINFTLDALTFLLGLIRESEIRLDVRIHRMSVSRIISLIPKFFNEPVLKEFAADFFDFLEIKFFKVSYIAPDECSEIIFTQSWRDIHPEISKLHVKKLEFEITPSNYRSLFLNI